MKGQVDSLWKFPSQFRQDNEHSERGEMPPIMCADMRTDCSMQSGSGKSSAGEIVNDGGGKWRN
jgi:hypothetical protein